MAQELGSKNTKSFPEQEEDLPPPTHQGDLAALCQGPVGEAGPQRWTQVPGKAWFKNKNHSPREIPLVSTFKSHNIKITKASGFQIKEDLKFWAKELALYSEAMAATEGFWRDQKNNITNNSRGLESDPDWNAGFSLAGNVIMSKWPHLHKSQFLYLYTYLLKWSWVLCHTWGA